MLFNGTISESTVTNWDEIQPSKYEANLEGALMLVYENECNYNALMRAAGLSELKYYQETGGDLFLQEAGAFGGFLEKAKAFFKAVVEKIKALFKKFFMTINKFVLNDKQWVKKYEKEIMRATNIKDMEFKGYTFKDLDKNKDSIKGKANSLIGGNKLTKISYANKASGDWEAYNDEDAVNDEIEKERGNIVGSSSPMDESEFRDKLKEMFYGDTEKEILDGSDIDLRQQLQYIRDIKDATKAANDMEKDVTKSIDDLIKAIESKIKEFSKVTDYELKNTPEAKKISDDKNEAIKALNQRIKIQKSISNDYTTVCGMLCQALKDRNRQAKAICIKAVSYHNKHKNESAVYSDSDDLFAGVTIR